MQLEMDRIAFQLYEIWGIPGTWNGMGKDVAVRKYQRKMRNPNSSVKTATCMKGNQSQGTDDSL